MFNFYLTEDRLSDQVKYLQQLVDKHEATIEYLRERLAECEITSANQLVLDTSRDPDPYGYHNMSTRDRIQAMVVRGRVH
jgi:hypothetical protein